MKNFRKVSFGNALVKSLLFSSLLMLLATYMSTVSSTLIAGRIVGNNALCAINLVSPLTGYANFIAGMIGIGSSLIYFRYLGADNTKKANEVFSQGIVLSIISGLLIFVIMTFGRDFYFNSLNVSQAVLNEAKIYWSFYRLFVSFLPFDFLLYELLFPDTKRIIAANIVLYVVGIGSSILLTRLYGTYGTSFGMAIGIIACDLVLCSHFFSNNSEFKFVFHFSFKDTLEVLRVSLVDSSTYLDTSLLVAFINRYVIIHFSESMLPITSIMITILDITVIFDCVGSAYAPVAEVYLGEENYKDEIDLTKYSLSIAIVLGAIFTLIFIIFAPLFPRFFNMNDPYEINLLIKLIRLFAPSLLLYSVSYMMISHYIAIRRITIAVIFEWLKAFIMPAICAFVFGNLFGFEGMWASFIIAQIISVFGMLLVIRLIFGKERSVWILDVGEYPTFSKSYIVNSDSIIEARNDAELFLKENSIDNGITSKIMMTIEDMTNLIKNHNNRKVIVQYNICIRDNCIYIYERDNGKPYELSNLGSDISSFNEYVFSCVVNSFDYKQHLIVVDYNRNIFEYKYN